MSITAKQKRFHLFVSVDRAPFPSRAFYRKSFVTKEKAIAAGKDWKGKWFEIYETQEDGSLEFIHTSFCKPKPKKKTSVRRVRS